MFVSDELSQSRTDPLFVGPEAYATLVPFGEKNNANYEYKIKTESKRWLQEKKCQQILASWQVKTNITYKIQKNNIKKNNSL